MYGIDIIGSTQLGKFYGKNGLWSNGSQVEQCVAFFLPENMELVVLINSPIGTPQSSCSASSASSTKITSYPPEYGSTRPANDCSCTVWMIRSTLTGVPGSCDPRRSGKAPGGVAFSVLDRMLSGVDSDGVLD